MGRLTRCIAIACSLLAGTAAAQSLPTGFVHELVAGGFVKPIGLAFLPDGRLLVVEQETHLIHVRTPGGVQGIVGTVPGVANGILEDERGIQHMAIDPQWPARPYLYVWYSHANPHTMWLSMFTVTGDLSSPLSTNLALGSQYVILNDVPKVTENHNGGAIRFGPDGMLYLSTGEDFQFCPAQDLGTGLGKILRLDVSSLPGAGPGPPPKAQIAAAGNPFNGPSDWSLLVWSYGLRNPFRFDIDPVTSHLMIADVGELAREEIDWGSLPGQNFGWPWFEGDIANVGCGGPAPPMLTPPIVSLSHSGSVFCVISLGFYRNPPASAFGFGAAYEGDYFYTDYIAGFIRRLKFNGASWSTPPVVPGQPSATNWGTGFLFITDSAVGPDGALYYLKRLPTGELRRIRGTANPPSFTAVQGNGEAVNAGTPAVLPPTTRFLTAGGSPIPGAPVTFSLTAGGGQLGPQPALTDALGYASTSFVPSPTDPTNPVITATTPGSAPVVFNLVWRGLLVDYQPQISTIAFSVRHSQTGSPFSLAFDAPPGAALAFTPWGLVWTSIVAPQPTLLVLDGLGLVGPPDPTMVSGSPVPSWSLVLPGLPPLGGVTLISQAYGIDTARAPAPDAYFVSNPVTFTLN
jgi:glucose/arabinose dehydrogenase